MALRIPGTTHSRRLALQKHINISNEDAIELLRNTTHFSSTDNGFHITYKNKDMDYSIRINGKENSGLFRVALYYDGLKDNDLRNTLIWDIDKVNHNGFDTMWNEFIENIGL